MRGACITISNIRPAADLKNKVNTLNIYLQHNTKGDKTDVTKEKNIILKHAKDCKRLIEYVRCMVDESSFNAYIADLNTAIELILAAIPGANNMENIRQVVSTFQDRSPRYMDKLHSLRTWAILDSVLDFMWNENDAYDLTESVLNNIAGAISTNKDLSMFSLQCKKGYDEDIISRRLSEVNRTTITSYALCANPSESPHAKQKINRVIMGTLKGSIISNEVFDILYLTPSVSFRTESRNNKLAPLNEEEMLRNCTRFLKNDGVLIYTIPFHALSSEIALTLSRKLNNITIFKHETDNTAHSSLKYITIMGQKRNMISYANTFTQLTTLNYNNLPTTPERSYNLDLPEAEVKLFRGSILDEQELDDIISGNGLFNEFFRQMEDKHKPQDRSPLLPFNLGQIGLVLSSGSLDGIVEESNNVRHIIKGMTIKETETETETNVGSNGEAITQSTETVRNKVQITAIGADGAFYKLT